MVIPRLLTILLVASAVCAQTNSPLVVHVSGSVKQCGKPRSDSLVRFVGSTTQIVRSDKAGAYQVDLPLGTWTATTPFRASDPLNESLSRVRHFRLTAPGSLILDIHLRPAIFCDVTPFNADERPPTPEESSQLDDACKGEMSYSVPSSDGAPFEVDLFGLVNVFDACSVKGSTEKHREFATYNLVSMQADKVSYDPRNRLLEASGQVVIDDEKGQRTAESIKFHIEDGQAIPLQQDH